MMYVLHATGGVLRHCFATHTLSLADSQCLCFVWFAQPSDFDDFGMAQICFEDMYLAIYKCDGPEWAKKLRDRTTQVLEGSALDAFHQRYENNWQSLHPGDLRSSYLTMAKKARKKQEANK